MTRLRSHLPAPAPQFGVQSRPRTPYAFEADNSRRSPDAAGAQLPALEANLGLTRESTEKLGITPLLLDLVLHHHLNIEWYDRRIAKEVRAKRWFFAFSILLLLAIPVVTYLISLRGGDASAALVGAQVTAVLTGIVAFHNALRSLFEKRSVITIFHKASATLKKALYEFEDRWAGCVPVNAGPELEIFKNSIRGAIRKARDVEAEERDAFFTAEAGYPVLDLRSALTQAGAAAAELVTRHRVPGAAPATTAAAGAAPRRKSELLAAKLALLRANAARTTDPEQLRIIQQEIAAVSEQFGEAEREELAVVMRQVDGLR